MTRSYDMRVKALCRDRLRQFIKAGFTAAQIKSARVLCFAGREALEIFEVYDQLGIPRQNILCLEKDSAAFEEIKGLKLGIQVRGLTLDQYFDRTSGDQFDIVSLDFTGQVGTYENALYRLRTRGFLKDHAIVFTNFCGAREAAASKGNYHLRGPGSPNAHLVLKTGEWLSRLLRGDDRAELDASMDELAALHTQTHERHRTTALRDMRTPGIHEVVRSALSLSTAAMIGVHFREWDEDESMTEMRNNLLSDACVDGLKGLLPEMVPIVKQQFAAVRRQDHGMPVLMYIVLGRSALKRVRCLADSFADELYELCGLNPEFVTSTLFHGINAFLDHRRTVRAAESYKYVSDRGTPMYADLFRVQRCDEFDYLETLLNRNAQTLDDLLRPIESMSGLNLLYLLDQLDFSLRQIGYGSEVHLPAPERVLLGNESKL